MITRGLSERRSLQVIGMSASSFRYQTAPDRNQALREQIITLAQRHRRYGSGMIYLKLRQAGQQVNHKRVERLYAEARLQVKRRRRKKVPVSDRHPLGRPQAANQVWSMDFVFDRTAEGRVIKNLTVVDDATHEAVAIVPERAIGGQSLTCTGLRGGEPRRHQTDARRRWEGRQNSLKKEFAKIKLQICSGSRSDRKSYISNPLICLSWT